MLRVLIGVDHRKFLHNSGAWISTKLVSGIDSQLIVDDTFSQSLSHVLVVPARAIDCRLDYEMTLSSSPNLIGRRLFHDDMKPIKSSI